MLFLAYLCNNAEYLLEIFTNGFHIVTSRTDFVYDLIFIGSTQTPIGIFFA